VIAPLVLALALTAQSPPPSQASLKAQHTADMKQMVVKRQLERTRTKLRRAAAAERAYSEQLRIEAFFPSPSLLRIEAYNARMAPIWAQQRRDAAELALQQQRADALSAIAGAARLEALTDRQRLAIQARRAGYPQVGLGQSVPPVP
jgi:hypothetical protein